MVIRCFHLSMVTFLSLCMTLCLACPPQCQCVDKKVSCAGASMKTLPVGLPTEMIEFNFTGNQLTYLGPKQFIVYTQLEVLDLSHNLISSVDLEAFGELQNLLKLYISNNRISSLERRSFIDIVKVNTIDLSKNPLVDLPRDIFNDCPWLSRLELRNTHLNQDDFEQINMLTKLEYLDISENNFTHLPYLMLSKLSNLHNIYLTQCNVRSVDTNAFVGLRSLQTLDLSANDIESIDRETYQVMESLSFLDISGNDLRCDCGTAQFKDWLEQKGVSLMTAAKCIARGDKIYDVRLDDLSIFCTSLSPTTEPPSTSCGSQGKIRLKINEISHSIAEITWNYESIPDDSLIIGNLRIYGKEKTETWYDFVISKRKHKFENLSQDSQYILCVFQKDCILYTCIDFSTQRDPSVGARKDTECIPLEISLGLGVAAGAGVLILAGVIGAILCARKGVSCCILQKKDPGDVPQGPVQRQTQPVIPMQISQSYIPADNTRQHKRFQSITSDTYDAIPMTPVDSGRREVFFNPGYHKERPRNVNDPLPPIISPDSGPVDDDSAVINGISSCYLHPDTGPQTPISAEVTPLPRSAAKPIDMYLDPLSPIMREPSKNKIQPQTRHTFNHQATMSLSESEPYHLYTEAQDIDIDITPAIPDRSTPKTMQRLFMANRPSLEDLKKQMDGSSGRVKKFSRPKLSEKHFERNISGLARNRSFSTPDILALSGRMPELAGRDLKSDA